MSPTYGEGKKILIFILRGLPGAGKSLWCNYYATQVVSADHYRMVDGEYVYLRATDPIVHQKCLKRFVEIISTEQGENEILTVDNTNTSALEIAPYYRLAEAFGVKPQILHFHCSIEHAYTNNIHKVPLNTLFRMDAALRENIPWAEEVQLGLSHDKFGPPPGGPLEIIQWALGQEYSYGPYETIGQGIYGYNKEDVVQTLKADFVLNKSEGNYRRALELLTLHKVI